MMIRAEMMIAATALAMLIAMPARACGNGECPPPPPPPPPPPVELPLAHAPKDDRAPHVDAAIVHFAWCCTQDGEPAWRTALFRDPVQAALQCQARVLRYEAKGQSLPECPHKRRVAE